MIPTPAAWRWLYDLAAALVLFPLLVAVSAESRPRGALLKISALVGMLSYGIYVLHVPIRNWIEAVMPILMPSWSTLPGLFHYGIVAIAAVVAAALLHGVYDTPVRRWLSRRRPREARA
jgi:peptidoglycan/LPS O-acetylase OafA/YrhL